MIGGATTPAPEAGRVAGVSPCLKLSPAAQSAGLFSGQGMELESRFWSPARTRVAVDLYRNDPSCGTSIVARVNEVDAHRLQPIADWKALRSRMGSLSVARHPDAATQALKRRTRTSDDPMVVMIRGMVAAGKVNREIAAAIGRSEGSLVRIMAQHKITRGGKRVHTERHERVRALVERGMTAEQIAAELSCHERTAKRWLREAGVPQRPTGRPAGSSTKRGRGLSFVVSLPKEKPAFPAQTVEEFLARGGQITRCPAVAVAPTQATIPAEDLAALQAVYAARQPVGNWRQQRAAFFNARAKR